MDRLQAIDAFLRTVELGSFTAAARSLGVTQSAVSKWVAALEDDLGVTLLDRNSRGHRTTAAGERLVAEGGALLAQWRATRDQLRPQPLAGRLGLGLPAVFGARHVVPLLPGLLARFPGLRLDLHLDDRRVRLLQTRLDLVLRLGPTPDAALASRVLGRSRRLLVASPRYLGRHGLPAHPRALARHATLPHLGPDDTHWTLTQDGTPCRVALDPVLRCDHSEAALQLAEHGLGIARLAEWLVAPAVAAGRLVVVLPDWSAGGAAVRALWAPEREGGGRRRRAFLDALAPALAARLAGHRVEGGGG